MNDANKLPSSLTNAGRLPPTEIEASQLIDIKSLALMLKVSEKTVRRWRDAGKIPRPVKLGRTLRWRLCLIVAWIDAGCPSARQFEHDFSSIAA